MQLFHELNTITMVLSDIALDIGLIVKAELDLKMSRMEVITSNIIVNICMWL